MRAEKRLIVRESFAMAFGGGTIFFVQLDGLGAHGELAMDKFARDMETLCKPSAPSLIGLHVKDTAVSRGMAERMIRGMNAPGQHIKKLAVVGLPWLQGFRWKRLLKAADPPTAYAFAFYEDFERAKLWLVK
jgi:hypothetical protein